jgi:hypothetical protein
MSKRIKRFKVGDIINFHKCKSDYPGGFMMRDKNTAVGRIEEITEPHQYYRIAVYDERMMFYPGSTWLFSNNELQECEIMIKGEDYLT